MSIQNQSEILCLVFPTAINVFSAKECVKSLIRMTEIRQKDLSHIMNVNKMCKIQTRFS